MATEIAKAYVQIIPSTKGIKDKLTEALGGEAKSAGKSSGASAAQSFGESLKSGLGSAASTLGGADSRGGRDCSGLGGCGGVWEKLHRCRQPV